MEFLNAFNEYGLPYVSIFAMGMFIMYMYNSHRNERAEWRKEHKEERALLQSDSVSMQQESNKVFTELTSVIRDFNR
jgi:hypothetical protein